MLVRRLFGLGAQFLKLLEFDEGRITGRTTHGIQFIKYERAGRPRGIQHAVVVETKHRIKNTALNDYIRVFSHYRKLKQKRSKRRILERLFRVYATGRKLRYPDGVYYAHFGNMDANPWPYKSEMRNYDLVRRLYFYVKRFDKNRQRSLAKISALGIVREESRAQHKIETTRGRTILGNLIPLLSVIFAAVFLDQSYASSLVDKILPDAITPQGQDAEATIVLVLYVTGLTWAILGLIHQFYKSIRVFALTAHKRQLELIDFAIQLAASEGPENQ